MKKTFLPKIVIFVILNIFILSIGAISFAKVIPPDHVNWNHINGCGYIFEESEDNYPYFYCGGNTSTASGKKAYVLVELQRLTDDPDEVVWETVYSFSDEGEMIALAEEEVEAELDTTYRLKVTHQVQTLSGEVLEEYIHYSRMIAIFSED